MVLKLEEIQVECIIGELEAERIKKQLLYVKAVIDIEEKSSLTDKIEDTLDYCEVVQKIRGNLEREKCRMLERAAKIVCDTCLSFGNVKFVKAEVRKEGTLRGVKSVTAEMEETR